MQHRTIRISDLSPRDEVSLIITLTAKVYETQTRGSVTEEAGGEMCNQFLARPKTTLSMPNAAGP